MYPMKKLLKFFLEIGFVLLSLAVTLYLLTPDKLQDTTTLGLKIRSQRWSGAITVKGDINFMPWATLTVEPGTTVLFEKKPDQEGTDWTKWADAYIKDHNDPTGRIGYGKTHFHLYGKILANGTADQPIIFTSAQTQPEYADWDQLILLSDSRLDWVELAYSHNGANIEGRNVTITNGKIHDSLWSCIDLFSWGAEITNNEVYHCWHQAIGIKTDAGSNHINAISGNNVHDAWLGLNCEGDAQPWVTDNKFDAAPVAENCRTTPPVSQNNTISDRPADSSGGTYGGQIIYPAASQ